MVAHILVFKGDGVLVADDTPKSAHAAIMQDSSPLSIFAMMIVKICLKLLLLLLIVEA